LSLSPPRLAAVVVTLGVLGSAGRARADATDRCLKATVEGQKLQRAGRLVAARESFLTCASPECPAEVVSRCEHWAQGVDALLPSIVVVARDDAGHDLTDVRAAIDERAATDLSPRAVELDPGEHRVTFARAGSPLIEQHVTLHDAEKNRTVLAVFPVVPSGPRQEPAKTAAGAPAIHDRPIPARVFVAGGVAVAGLAAFGILAVKGANDRSADHCDTGCTTAQKSSVDAELRGADIALGIGLVALGVTAWMYFTRPSVPRATARALTFDATGALTF
jgi:hypothetical protein